MDRNVAHLFSVPAGDRPGRQLRDNRIFLYSLTLLPTDGFPFYDLG
jgi:hypothetical protein